MILLIDEYDAPIINAINSGCYNDELRNFLSILYSSALKGNVYLERGILTGIQRVAKENIFSGLNSIDVNTVLTKYFILNNISFHDHSKIYENSYHMFTLGMILSCVSGYNVYSNKEFGLGRVDILCESKGSKPHLIFEFKVGVDPSIAIK